MGLTRTQAEEIAEIRGQIAVFAIVSGRDSWLMTDNPHTSLDGLAQSLNTDSWNDWTDGKLKAFDKNDNLITDTESPQDWAKLEPITFRNPKKLHVAKSPCASCPYRKDTPLGIWDTSEYEKLRGYDDPQTCYKTFLCHYSDVKQDTICRGWLTVHKESVAARLATMKK